MLLPDDDFHLLFFHPHNLNGLVLDIYHQNLFLIFLILMYPIYSVSMYVYHIDSKFRIYQNYVECAFELLWP